jgi:hypothetical protein
MLRRVHAFFSARGGYSLLRVWMDQPSIELRAFTLRG